MIDQRMMDNLMKYVFTYYLPMSVTLNASFKRGSCLLCDFFTNYLLDFWNENAEPC
jgi:hypothetical protein